MAKTYGTENAEGEREFFPGMGLFPAMAFCKKHDYSLIYRDGDRVETLVRRGSWPTSL